MQSMRAKSELPPLQGEGWGGDGSRSASTRFEHAGIQRFEDEAEPGFRHQRTTTSPSTSKGVAGVGMAQKNGLRASRARRKFKALPTPMTRRAAR